MEYRVKIPMNTPSARLVRHIKDDSLTHYALKRAKAYQKSALLALHPFRGFEDNASLTGSRSNIRSFKCLIPSVAKFSTLSPLKRTGPWNCAAV